MGFSPVLELLVLLFALTSAKESGNHPDWPRWCGKVYKPDFEPGGRTIEPAPLSNGPALDLQFKPRYSIYLEGEKQAEFIVNAGISKWHGQKWPSLSSPSTAPPVVFSINLASNNDVLISNTVNVSSTDNVFAFDLAHLKPRFQPYEVVLFGATPDGTSNVTASSELVFLPEKKTGSVTKLDNLHGGILFRSPATGNKFEPFLPFGFFASCDHFLCEKDYVRTVKAYQDLGLNSLVSLTTVQRSRGVYSYMDRLGLHYMYDLRGYYKNLTAVREQVSVIREFDGLYSYWGADEPDGHQDAFGLLPKVRDAIRQLDPYHPVSVTLNCQNFHFKEYTAGADFIMEDVYPIGINSTFSKWGTPVNATYGDCGCDNCQGNVQDVSRRLDTLAQYEEWLGFWPKTKGHNSQGFHGEGYWSRDPTDEEQVAMNALAVHHGAKAFASWLWPASSTIGKIMGKFGSTLSRNPVRDFVVVGSATRVEVGEYDVVDAAYWVSTEKKQLLLSVVNAGYDPLDREIAISLPKGVVAKSKESVVWGSGTWSLGDGGIKLSRQSAMSTNMVILGI